MLKVLISFMSNLSGTIIKEFVQEIESLCQHAFNRYQVFLEEKFLKKQKVVTSKTFYLLTFDFFLKKFISLNEIKMAFVSKRKIPNLDLLQ
jgi:hypothetical protein